MTANMTMKKDLKVQDVEKVKGRAMLRWDGKHPLERVEYFPAQEKEVYGDKKSKEFNKIFWGDNLQVLSHLLKEYRGKIDLIYIDPPFDSKADYVKKVKYRGIEVEGAKKTLFEEKQYSDIWEKDEYYQFLYERFQIMKELLKDTGTIYVHCDYRRGHHIKLILDEVFGEENIINELIWHYSGAGVPNDRWAERHDLLFWYSKGKTWTFNADAVRTGYAEATKKRFSHAIRNVRDGHDFGTQELNPLGKYPEDVLDVSIEAPSANIRTGYPTQKPEELLEKLIRASSNVGDVVADFFSGSGTTLAVAQKLGRKWIGCDINIGAMQTMVKRLSHLINNQLKSGFNDEAWLLTEKEVTTAKNNANFGFKVLNVNEYDVFKNEVEAKQIIMEIYGVEKVRTRFFDGILDKNFVKVMPINRVCSKKDVDAVLKGIKDGVGEFTVKTKSRHGEPVYDQGVTVFCSGMEMDMIDYLKKENSSGVEVDVRDILLDKQTLIFKQKPEAEIIVKAKGGKVTVRIAEFISPILIRKLDIENSKALKKEGVAKVEDFRQIIDSVAIDVDFDGKLFNADIIDVPTKNDLIKGEYLVEYPKKGKKKLAVKIVDVLGEEYFETFEVTV